MATALDTRRSGITLMEVLISIGILSIGLASVVALIPAGGNEARRALIADRCGQLSANAMADAIARGMLNSAKWSPVPPAPPITPPYRIALDPLGAATFPASMTPILLDNIPPSLVGAVSTAAEVAFRGEDDVTYSQPVVEDAPAVPVYSGSPPGIQRASTGAFSWLATLLPAGGPTANNYRLSVVVFHGRVPPAFPGPFGLNGLPLSADVQVTGLGMSTDDFRETFTRGAPILLASGNFADIPVWRTIVLPLPDRQGGGMVNDAELVLDAPVPFAATQVFVFPGAVGIAEKTVRLEGQSTWAL